MNVEQKQVEDRKQIAALKKEIAAANSAETTRDRHVIKFTERQRVEGMSYSAGDTAGFDEVVYKKVLLARTGVDFRKWAHQQIRGLERKLKEQNVPETKEVTKPDPDKPKTRDVGSPR